MDFKAESLKLHEQHRGKVAIQPKVKVKTREDLSAAYTPGVAEPCLRIAEKRTVRRFWAWGILDRKRLCR